MAFGHSKTDLHPPFAAYRGAEPYVFVSYAHADAAEVYPELERLHAAGFPVWYDEGISPGHDWPQELASAIEGCALFLLFVSPRSVESENCKRETTFALSTSRPLLALHLRETELPSGLALSIGNSQAILAHRLERDAFERKLDEALASIIGAPLRGAAREPELLAAPRSRSKALLAIAAAALVVAVLGGYRYWSAASTERWIAGTALPAVEAALAEQRLLDAYEWVQRVEQRNPEHVSLATLWPRVALHGTILSEPSGAAVSLRPLAGDGRRLELGRTPLRDFPLPLGSYAWRLDAGEDGHREFVRGHQSSWFGTVAGATAPVITLGRGAGAMLHVPRNTVVVAATNFVFHHAVTVPEFHIGRDEVNNAEYQEFVDAGGYQDENYWRGLGLIEGDGALSWADVQALLVDATGRPGPATWELGAYPPDKGMHPVNGVSWFEAMAYARFRDMELPTLRHWMAVAVPYYAPVLIPFSNLTNSEGTVPVTNPTVDPVGTRNIFGNVREWLLNASGEHRWIMGGSSESPPYMASHRYTLPPLDRSPANGIRLAEYSAEFAPAWRNPVTIESVDYRTVEPVSDDAFAVMREQFVDVGPDLSPRHEQDPETGDGWVHERISVASSRPDDRLVINLYLPKAQDGPSQAVILFPGFDAFQGAGQSHPSPAMPIVDFIPRGGRALVAPVFWGSYERYAGLFEMSEQQRAAAQTELRREWYTDLKRTIDYLETRDDIDTERLAYFGISFGASHALPILAIEQRLDAAVLLLGGLNELGFRTMPSAADPVNYVSRITVPVLMLGGRFDSIFHVETSQRPLLRMLGTPDEHKALKLYDVGHVPIPRTELMRETADWLDRYLGPI